MCPTNGESTRVYHAMSPGAEAFGALLPAAATFAVLRSSAQDDLRRDPELRLHHVYDLILQKR
jgi:hypothetical protein